MHTCLVAAGRHDNQLRELRLQLVLKTPQIERVPAKPVHENDNVLVLKRNRPAVWTACV